MLTPTPVKQESPKLLKPSIYKRKLTYNTMTAADAGLYTNEDVREFWKRIVNRQHVDTALEEN